MRNIFNRILENRLELLLKTRFAENALFPAAATAACGFIELSPEPLRGIYPFAFVIMVISWIAASAAAGFLKHWFFILYSGVFWLLPYQFAEAAGGEGAEGLTVVNNILARIAELITVAAPELLSGVQISGFTVSQVFLTGSLALFAAGYLIRRRARQSRIYCEVRLKLMENDQ